MVPGAAEQQTQDGEHRADTCRPDATNVALRPDGLADTKQDEHHADEQTDEQIPHLKEIMEILVGLHVDDALIGVGIAVLE